MNWIGAFAIFWLLWTGKEVFDDIKTRFEEDDEDDEPDEEDEDTSTAEVFRLFDQAGNVSRKILQNVIILISMVMFVLDITGFLLSYLYVPYHLIEKVLLVIITAFTFYVDAIWGKITIMLWVVYRRNKKPEVLDRYLDIYYEKQKMPYDWMPLIPTYGRFYAAINLVLWSIF